MSFLLDSDICSAFLNGDAAVFQKFQQHGGQLFLSAINQAELLTWAYRSNAPQSRLAGLIGLLDNVVVIPFDAKEVEETAHIRARQLDIGKPVPTVDSMIAATAVVHDLILVTHNTADFQSIPGLQLEDWLRP